MRFRLLLSLIVPALPLFPCERGLAQTNPKTVFIEDFTSQELGAAIKAGSHTVLIYSGSVEASGPHLALGKHNFRVRVYAQRIAEALSHTLVAPIISVAPNAPELTIFPGTIALRPETFAALNEDIARSLIQAGFTNIILLGDHGLNQEPLQELAGRLDAELRPRGVRIFFSSDGYAKSTADILQYASARGLSAAGHGGLWDTSELWAVAPQAVRPQLMAPGNPPDSAVDAHGVTGDPRRSSMTLGRAFGKIRVDNAVAEIRRFLSQAP